MGVHAAMSAASSCSSGSPPVKTTYLWPENPAATGCRWCAPGPRCRQICRPVHHRCRQNRYRRIGTRRWRDPPRGLTKVAAAKAAKHRRPPRVRAFALQGVKNFFDAVSHGMGFGDAGQRGLIREEASTGARDTPTFAVCWASRTPCQAALIVSPTSQQGRSHAVLQAASARKCQPERTGRIGA